MSQNEAAGSSSSMTEGTGISEDPMVHHPQCHYYQYAQVHIKAMSTEEELRQRVTENLMRRRHITGKTPAQINNEVMKAMSPTGVISQYLKGKKEVYDSFKPLLKTFCNCESAKIGNRQQQQTKVQEKEEGQNGPGHTEEDSAQGHPVKELGHQETLPTGEVEEPQERPANPGPSGTHKLTEYERKTFEEVGLDLSDDDDDEDEVPEMKGVTVAVEDLLSQALEWSLGSADVEAEKEKTPDREEGDGINFSKPHDELEKEKKSDGEESEGINFSSPHDELEKENTSDGEESEGTNFSNPHDELEKEEKSDGEESEGINFSNPHDELDYGED